MQQRDRGIATDPQYVEVGASLVGGAGDRRLGKDEASVVGVGGQFMHRDLGGIGIGATSGGLAGAIVSGASIDIPSFR